MAGKKPAKPMAGQAKQIVQDPAVYGSMVKFMGTKTATSVCARCGKVTVNGMIRVKEDKSYCSGGCAKAS
jgi:hypothetical protein